MQRDVTGGESTPLARLEVRLTWEKLELVLALGRANQAEHSLHEAIRDDQSDLESWQLLLEILLIEDRTFEFQCLGWQAYNNVRPDAEAVAPYAHGWTFD